MKIVVSGASGFVGRHLTTDLVNAGHSVVGVGLGDAPDGLECWHQVDLSARWPDEALAEADAVVHLAALAAVGGSFDDPQAWIVGNSAPLTSLGEQLLKIGSAARVLFVSSGSVYAPGVGLDESAITVPSSPYAVSKLLGELQAEYYRRRGLDVVVARPFNHIGPGQGPGFLLPALVEGARAGRVVAGDLSTRRDYTDVRDVVRAYRLLIEAPALPRSVFNVCSGESVSGTELLRLVEEGLGGGAIPVEVDPGRLRPDDPHVITGSRAALTGTVGWEPKIPLRQTITDSLAARNTRSDSQSLPR